MTTDTSPIGCGPRRYGARMTTLLFVHAHPDDECILTGSTIALASRLGMRSILVYGTRGDAGETGEDLGDETLGERRVRETLAAADVLGAERVEWLPFADSGMAGTETTANRDAFSNADPADAASRIAELVEGEEIAAVIGYDANGTYGHPDHIQVHHVAHALGPLVDAPWVLEATYSREYLASLPDADGTLDLGFASAEADLTHFVQGEDLLQAKLTAVTNHWSQVPDDYKNGEADDNSFRLRFGTEWYIATPQGDATELGPIAQLFTPKADWPGPLPNPE